MHHASYIMNMQVGGGRPWHEGMMPAQGLNEY